MIIIVSIFWLLVWGTMCITIAGSRSPGTGIATDFPMPGTRRAQEADKEMRFYHKAFWVWTALCSVLWLVTSTIGMGQIVIVIFFLGCFVVFVVLPAWFIWMLVSQFVAELKDPGCFTLHPVGPRQRSRTIHPVGQTYQERQEWDGPRAEGKNWL